MGTPERGDSPCKGVSANAAEIFSEGPYMAQKKQIWTVRVVLTENDRLAPMLPGVWVEQLRYMGIAREIKVNVPSGGTEHMVLEFSCPEPYGRDTKIWAEQNAARMQSFGFMAAAAPKWGG